VPCRVMFYVQHLLGIGHLKRAALIARAMVEAGLDVAVVLGGREVPGMDFTGCARVLLPAVRAADATFRTLLDEHDEPIDDAWRDHRTQRLLFEFEALQPEVLMLELFPFGRRMFGFELMPLLSAARASAQPPKIVCSLRDILVRKADPERNRKAVAVADAWFDRILVHGDPRLVPIEGSFPEMDALADKLTYTGYVVARGTPAAQPPSPIGDGEVIVSVGGGAVGLPLLRTAIAARPLSRLADRPWRLLAGPNLPQDDYARLAWSPPPGFVVERWRDDLPALLRSCALSISQAGYNTVMDVLQARVPAVLVPFAEGQENEQVLRASLLEQRGLAVGLEPARLSPQNLAAAIDRALTLPPASAEIEINGAQTTARLIGELGGTAGGHRGVE
jgi:predicted glycosyltransferase